MSQNGDQRLERSFTRDALREAIIQVGLAVAPDGVYDPADDPRAAQAVSALAQLVEDTTLAEAVADALRDLYMRWVVDVGA